jgi:hypothetical protein
MWTTIEVRAKPKAPRGRSTASGSRVAQRMTRGARGVLRFKVGDAENRPQLFQEEGDTSGRVAAGRQAGVYRDLPAPPLWQHAQHSSGAQVVGDHLRWDDGKPAPPTKSERIASPVLATILREYTLP